MKTSYFQLHELQAAGQMLARGQLVAFPTETVYGLGANALDESAVKSIFTAKGRPSDNPLIVHIAHVDQLSSLVREVSQDSERLLQQFWPGPLTLVFPKKNSVPDAVTAGLDTVAVRIPSHPWAVELIQFAGVPVAAPSANRSGCPSATTWQSVREDLDGRIDGIVCGPSTDIGLESTVVDASVSPPRILRPGKISYEDLAKTCPDIVPYGGKFSATTDNSGLRDVQTLNSPGLRHRHYQPRAKVVIVANPTYRGTEIATYIGRTDSLSDPAPSNRNDQSEQHAAPKYASVQSVASAEDYAAKLFDFFRRSDEIHAARIECQAVSMEGIGAALMDRLSRAAEPQEAIMSQEGTITPHIERAS